MSHHCDDSIRSDSKSDVGIISVSSSNNTDDDDHNKNSNSVNVSPLSVATAVVVAVAGILGNEFRLQYKLSKVPQVFYQHTIVNERIVSLLSKFLMRKMTPSLIFGTHPVLNSCSGYAKLGPRSQSSSLYGSHKHHHHQYGRIREVLTMTSDGAKVALDWEFPVNVCEWDDDDDVSVEASSSSSSSSRQRVGQSHKQSHRDAVRGPHRRPVVVLLHGINNDAEFGYIRCMMESCTKRGWIAVGMNMRGCGSGMALSTPRGYNGAYTGDIRSVVNILAHRMAEDVPNACIFIAGYSLGANLIVKYLGEEGLAGTLPHKVKAGLSLGNPLRINSGNLKFPWNVLLGAGIKRGVLLKHYQSLKQMRCETHQRHLFDALMAPTLGELDHRVSPVLIRNDIHYPFTTHIGFKNGQDYWDQASSCNYIQHVSVPLMVVMSKDDFLIRHVAMEYIPHCIQSNPNVIFIESETGGHLGWNVVKGNNPFGDNPFGSAPNWCDELSSKFIESLIWMGEHETQEKMNENNSNTAETIISQKQVNLSPLKESLRSRL